MTDRPLKSILWVASTPSVAGHWKARIRFSDGTTPWVHFPPGLSVEQALAEAKAVESAGPQEKVDMGSLAKCELDSMPDIDLRYVFHAVYAGWDGRFVKFGMTVGKDGLVGRARAYHTHNPLFRMVAAVECQDPGAVESALVGLHAHDAVFDRRRNNVRPHRVEWFRPSWEVIQTVKMLHDIGLNPSGREQARGDGRNLSRLSFDEIVPAIVGRARAA